MKFNGTKIEYEGGGYVVVKQNYATVRSMVDHAMHPRSSYASHGKMLEFTRLYDDVMTSVNVTKIVSFYPKKDPS